ncbi:hypothetical protein D9M68_837010 [compost metagenome]
MRLDDGPCDLLGCGPFRHGLVANHIVGLRFGDLVRLHQNGLGIGNVPHPEQLCFHFLQAPCQSTVYFVALASQHERR